MSEKPGALAQYVTFVVDDQLFGVPIGRVHDVFVPAAITRVPLAPPDVAGVLNLRGRVVTAVDMRRRLGLSARPDATPAMAVGIEARGESFGFVIDGVGEVLALSPADLENNPANLDARWAAVSAGVHRLDGRLMVLLDVDRVLRGLSETMAA
jgi:purine-binding chemotaxis protein CheW